MHMRVTNVVYDLGHIRKCAGRRLDPPTGTADERTVDMVKVNRPRDLRKMAGG